MLGLRHFPRGRISRFGADPWSSNPAERAELVHHLSTDCRRCWSAAEDLEPGSVRRSCDPVAQALYRLSTPQSQALLTADHLAAVEGMRQRPFGFAFLLLEEAFSLAWAGQTPIPLEDVFKLIGSFRPRRHLEHHDDLYARALAYLSMVRTSRAELDAAHVAWIMAERHRMCGTGDHRLSASVLEARALLAAADGDARAAETFLGSAIDRLAASSEHALRRVELHGLAIPRLRARMGFHADELASAVAEARKTALRLAEAPKVDPQRVESLLASSATTLAATSKLVDGLSEINEDDLEARRLATIIAERLQGARRAVAQFERYFKVVYGGGKK